MILDECRRHLQNWLTLIKNHVSIIVVSLEQTLDPFQASLDSLAAARKKAYRNSSIDSSIHKVCRIQYRRVYVVAEGSRCLSQWRILKDWSCSTSSGHKSQQIDGGSYNQGSAMGLKTGCGRGLGWDVSSRIQAYGSHHCFACSKSFQQGGD